MSPPLSLPATQLLFFIQLRPCSVSGKSAAAPRPIRGRSIKELGDELAWYQQDGGRMPHWCCCCPGLGSRELTPHRHSLSCPTILWYQLQNPVKTSCRPCEWRMSTRGQTEHLYNGLAKQNYNNGSKPIYLIASTWERYMIWDIHL